MSGNDAIVTITENPHVYNEKSKRTVTITATEMPSTPPNKRPNLGRRQTKDSHIRGGEDSKLTPFGMKFFAVMDNKFLRYCLYVLPVAAVLAIPLALYATIFSSYRSSGIRLLGLFIWLQVIWATLWLSKIIAMIIPVVYQAICHIISSGISKYYLVLRAVEIPISLFLWTCFAYALLPLVYIFDTAYYQKHASSIIWIKNLNNVCKGSMGVTAIYLAQKLIIQLTSISYHKKQFHDKILEIKKTSSAIEHLYEASLKRFGDREHDFLMELDFEIHDSNSLQKVGRVISADRSFLQFIGDMNWFSDQVTSVFSRMAREITGNSLLDTTTCHAIVEQAFERRSGAEALAQRVFMSLVQPGYDALYEHDIISALGPGREEAAAMLFATLDRDQNGDVSLDEMIMMIGGIAHERKQLWRGACDIKDSIKILDRVLGFFVIILIVLVYAAFFSAITTTQWTQIWSTFTGLSFLFSATAGELFAACILVFVKHPYDVGDRVDVNNMELEVIRISLLYSVFRRIDSDRIVQVPNSVINGLWCENVTRSKAMKERLTFSVSPGTSFDDIELLRKELEAFVLHPDNKRDFQNEIDIQLLSVGDLKQLDLRVEIRHKSNWANEALRAKRRSKFMCALLSAMRKIPIDGPAGGGPFPGTPECPQYAVTITDAESKAALAAYNEKKDNNRLIPKSQANNPEVVATAISSGLDLLPSLIPRKDTVALHDLSVASNTTKNPFFSEATRVELPSRASNYPIKRHEE